MKDKAQNTKLIQMKTQALVSSLKAFQAARKNNTVQTVSVQPPLKTDDCTAIPNKLPKY